MSIFAPDLLADKVAIVTGGGTGIGREISRQLAMHGAHVIVASRNREHLEDAAKEIESFGRKSLAVETDIRHLEQVEALFERVAGEFGRIDLLVNNAGGQFLALFEEISAGGWRAVVDLNLNGTFYCCKTATRFMIPARSGCIINIVTILALGRGAKEMAHSGAARAGVVNLTKTLALELGRHNIRVNAIAPGTIETAGLLDEMRGRGGTLPEAYLEREQQMIPLKRFGAPLDVANAVLYLASPAGDYVTGSVLVVDGGLSRSNWPSLWGLFGGDPMAPGAET